MSKASDLINKSGLDDTSDFNAENPKPRTLEQELKEFGEHYPLLLKEFEQLCDKFNLIREKFHLG